MKRLLETVDDTYMSGPWNTSLGTYRFADSLVCTFGKLFLNCSNSRLEYLWWYGREREREKDGERESISRSYREREWFYCMLPGPSAISFSQPVADETAT